MRERSRHDADDFVWNTVEDDRAADARGIAPEARLPEAVTEQGDTAAASRTFSRAERAAERRRDTKGLEESRRDDRTPDLRRIARVRQREPQDGVCRHPLERRALPPPVVEVRIRADVFVESLARVVGP